MRFNPPPGWPSPPDGWTPPPGWNPDPSWPAPPDGWQLWLPDADNTSAGETPAADGGADAAASLVTATPVAPTTPSRAGLTRGRHAADDPARAPVLAHAAADSR